MTENYLPAITNGENGFYRYLREINKIKSLTQKEEYDYAVDFHHNGNNKSAHKLVLSHLKLVARVAISYKNYGLPLVDLISEGNIGLMQAIKKFDPYKGFRLSTYAVWWIKASIQEFILRSWSLVKIGTTAAQKKLFFNLGKIKRRIRATEAREFNSGDYAAVANELNVSENEVAEMNSRLSPDFSLNDGFGDSEDKGLIDILSDQEASQESLLLESQISRNNNELLSRAIETLSDREKHIIIERKLKEKPVTLENLSKIYNISKERVRQIEERAVAKMRDAMIDSHNKQKLA